MKTKQLKWSKYNNTTPFGDLSISRKVSLIKHFRQGGGIYCISLSMRCKVPIWCETLVYKAIRKGE